MIKKPPSLLQMIAMSGFVLSCFAIALFLWISFGGPTPLAPEPYTFKAHFDEGTQLAEQSDVRISGVTVGKVTGIELDPEVDLAEVEISMDSAYAPIPVDTRAVLRLKTLLGETYVELAFGDEEGPALPEGGTLPQTQIADTVQLDEILRALDPQTRTSLRTWMIDSSKAIAGRGRNLSSAIAYLQGTFSGFDRIFRTLNSQEEAVRQLFANGARTFDALSRRRGALSGAIQSANAVMQTAAQRDRDLVAMFQAFPTYLEESERTLARLREFSRSADPLMVQLTPAARELSPTLVAVADLAPEARGFFRGLDPVIDGADEAFPAFRSFFRDDFAPLLADFRPFLRELNPILEGIGAYRRELAGLLGNAASVSNPISQTGPNGERQVHYLRALTGLSPGALSIYPERRTTERANPYVRPGGYERVANGMLSFETRQCAGGLNALLDPTSPTDPDFNQRTGGDVTEAQDFFDRLQEFAFVGETETDDVPAPPCIKQPDFGPFGGPGAATDYPHTLRQP